MAFIDLGEFEAMKTLSSRRAPRCDKHQFRAKITVSTLDGFGFAVRCEGRHFLILYARAHVVSFPGQIPRSLVLERD